MILHLEHEIYGNIGLTNPKLSALNIYTYDMSNLKLAQ